MADIQQIYFTTLTAVGEAKDAKAKALGTALKFTAMAVGDGNGALPVPDRTRTALVREVRRASINTLKQDPKNPGQLIAEQVIPEDEGGWWIRELGLYDADGDLFAIANCPETYKPVLAQGSGRTQVVRMVLLMTSAASVQLKVDPSVVLATRQYVDDQDAAHAGAADPHPQYMTEPEVKKFGVQFSAPIFVNASRALTAAECVGNMVVIAGNAGPVTLTLPAVSECPPGTVVNFLNAGSSDVTLSRAANDGINNGGGTALPTVTLRASDSLSLATLPSNANWQGFAGTGQLASSPLFNALKAANGFQKFPNGMILQWGQFTQNDTGTATFYSFNLPIAFPNACHQAMVAIGSQVNGGAVSCSAEGMTRSVINGYTVGPATSRLYRVFAIGN